MDFVVIPANTVIYRASDVIEINPQPRLCDETGKTGVYFSAFSPYLAETMILEYGNSLYINVYELTKDISVNVGKYGFTRNYTGRYARFNWTVPEEDNISHFDNEICPIGDFIKEFNGVHGELFLVERELSTIQYKSTYIMTFEEAKRKWGKDIKGNGNSENKYSIRGFRVDDIE